MSYCFASPDIERLAGLLAVFFLFLSLPLVAFFFNILPYTAATLAIYICLVFILFTIGRQPLLGAGVLGMLLLFVFVFVSGILLAAFQGDKADFCCLFIALIMSALFLVACAVYYAVYVPEKQCLPIT